MATRERPVDRAARLGSAALRRIGEDIRIARVGRGLSLANVAAAADISLAEVSRIERGGAPKVPYIVVARLCGALGLDVVLKAYPGGHSVRDAGHVAFLTDFARLVHPSRRWDTEVPLPIAGDQRAWDGLIRGAGWRFAAEAETSPRDGQALVRRLQLKLRDGDVDGLILLVRDTRTTREFLEVAEPELRSVFPMSTRTILGALRRGASPPGSGVVVVPRSRRSADVSQISRGTTLRPALRALHSRPALEGGLSHPTSEAHEIASLILPVLAPRANRTR